MLRGRLFLLDFPLHALLQVLLQHEMKFHDDLERTSDLHVYPQFVSSVNMRKSGRDDHPHPG
jgi:hypothetical protein